MAMYIRAVEHMQMAWLYMGIDETEQHAKGIYLENGATAAGTFQQSFCPQGRVTFSQPRSPQFVRNLCL